MSIGGERGQSSAEYLGVILLVALVVSALVASGVAGSITGGLQDAVCKIAGGDCGTDQAGPDGSATAQELAAREQALADLGARGGGYRQLLDQARAARERGDFAEAERILEQLELYKRLVAANRGDLVDSLVSGSDAEFDELVGRETIDGDHSNRRYFRVAPSPGDGVVAMDFFIPGARSTFLKGDDRGTEDPLLGPYGLDRSRVVVVIDRESGRGVVYQSGTCTVSLPRVGSHCEDPRPIELRAPKTRPQINPIPGPQAPNEFDVNAGNGSLELNYDVLNSVTPVAFSVDGSVRLERGPDGNYRVTRDTRDRYPRIVISQYRPGRPPKQIHENDDQPVLEGATPPILKPSCENPILKRIPKVC